MVEAPSIQRTDPDRAPDRSRILVVLIVVLAVIGTLVATWTIVGARTSAQPGVGDPVDTNFGTMTVTRVSKTFVPDTQGPPTAAQHVGANGNDQLQVWVSLRNTDDESGVSFAPEQFSLITTADGKPRKQQAAGSSLGEGSLAKGGSIDGQVWFDSLSGTAGRRWLVFAPPGGDTIRVSLGNVDLSKSPPPGSDPSHDNHSHSHTQSHSKKQGGGADR